MNMYRDSSIGSYDLLNLECIKGNNCYNLHNYVAEIIILK